MAKAIQFTLLLFIGLAFQSFSQTPSEASIKKDLNQRKDSLDRIEGIWVVSTIQQFYRYDTLYDVIKYPKGARVGVVREGDHFRSYNLSGEGAEVEFTSSDVDGVYIY